MNATKTISQPRLTHRQVDILLLLFRFRFLSRPQIQKLLKHKDHRQILLWINRLTEEGYVIRYYNQKQRNDPAVYSLGRASRRYLKNSPQIEYPELLDRVRREQFYSGYFRENCLYLVDTYLAIKNFSQDNIKLTYLSKTDLYGIDHLMMPTPDAYFSLKPNYKTKQYFIELLVGPIKVVKKRIEQYVDYYQSHDWQENEKSAFPEVILICQNPPLVRRLAGYIEKEFEDRPNFSLLARGEGITELLPKKKAAG